MNSDLGGWGRLFGVLSIETALLLLVATGLAFQVQGAQARRLVWRVALVALTLVWLMESLGGRGSLEFRALRSDSSSRQIITTTLDAPGFPPPVPDLAAVTFHAPEPTLPAPVWWPGILWLIGTLSYSLRSVLTRVWLSWRCRKHSSASLAAVDPFTRATVDELSRVLGLRSVRLFCWPELKGPIAFGIFRPTVVVPADFAARFSSDQRAAILAHELGHLAARDPAWLGLAQILTALAWWNPLIWWLQRQVRQSSEAAADDASGVIPGGRVALAESLVTLGREWVSPAEAHRWGVTGSGPASELARRVRALLETSETPHPPRTRLRWALSASLGMLGFTLLALPVPVDPVVSLPRLLAAAKAHRVVQTAEPRTKEPEIAIAPISPAETLSAPAPTPASDHGFPTWPLPGLSYNQAAGETFRSIPVDPRVPVYPLTAPVTQRYVPGTQRYVPLRSESGPSSLGSPSSAKVEPGSDPLILRTYRVDSAALLSQIRGQQAPPNPALDPAAEIRTYLAARGLEFPTLASTPALPEAARKSLFFRPDPGILLVRASAQEQAVLEKVVQEVNTQPPSVKLTVRLVEVAVGGADDTGLDWVFGMSPTNNPTPEITAPTGTLPGASAPFADQIEVERLSIRGQSATLSAAQFAALQHQLRARAGNDWLAVPSVVTSSGRQARVSVQDVRTIVTGPRLIPPSATNAGELRYETSPIETGPVVDLMAEKNNEGWDLSVVAQVNEFLGYAEPKPGSGPRLQVGKSQPITGREALPRFRARELAARGTLQTGETLALRGPQVNQVVRFKDQVPVLGSIPLLGRLFRSEGSQSIPKRLYVFVTVETNTALTTVEGK